MRWSKALIPTHKEDPSNAETTSHKLMLRAGLIRGLTSGVYSYLPLGWRVLRKIEGIVREELDAVGCQEILMPVISPAELWKETGRWGVYGKELWRVNDRNGREFALGPTHEEVVTDIVRNEINSYKQLPFTVYQIQTKFRDEIRPRFGVVRAREFTMKDAYSFHRDEESLDETYRVIYDVYSRIFDRCDLVYRPVEAATGAIGGSSSHEFMVLSDTGESEVIVCECGYAATSEQAEGLIANVMPAEEPLTMEEVATPDMKTIDEVAGFLKIAPWRLVKTIIYVADEKPVLAVIRGDREINEEKLARVLGANVMEAASQAVIEKITGAPVGFAGPVGLSGVRQVIDRTVEPLRNIVVGGNKADTHLRNVNHGRDFAVSSFEDIAQIGKGDACAGCGKEMDSFRGIEVSQVFKLGTKYSDSMNATFLDENGKARPFVMGCYGLGVSRTVAAVIEQHSDDDGIAWPMSVAPFEVLIVALNNLKSDAVREAAEGLYEDLRALGVDTLLDDRADSAGVKFKDADLIGIPVRVTIGDRGLDKGVMEVRLRKSGEKSEIPKLNAAAEVLRIVEKLRG